MFWDSGISGFGFRVEGFFGYVGLGIFGLVLGLGFGFMGFRV